MLKMMWALEDSGFAQWVAGAPTIWAYPSILTFHTVGMGIVVGISAVLDLRLLGVGPEVPVGRLKALFPALWWGFWLNAVTGVVLFIAHAAEKFTQEVFYVKLSLIALALYVFIRIQREIFPKDASAPTYPITGKVKRLAILSLILWAGAITAGRLMAYINLS
jgi:hypothetical protein